MESEFATPPKRINVLNAKRFILQWKNDNGDDHEHSFDTFQQMENEALKLAHAFKFNQYHLNNIKGYRLGIEREFECLLHKAVSLQPIEK